MAGRGKRLGEIKSAKNIALAQNTNDEFSDIGLFINKINDINIENVNQTLVSSIHNLFKQKCTSKKILKDIVSKLYTKALSDLNFGQKFLIAFEELSHYEVEGFLVRTELLSFVQEDFKLKDTMSQSDPKKFLNVVMTLGEVYQRIKIYGVPIVVLGIALMEYFDLLLKGEEEEFKVLTKQILINGERISTTKELSQKYELLKHNIRSTLINRNLNCSSKCWILLTLDFMSNDLKPLTGVVRNFYYGNLGDEYKKLESLIEFSNQKKVDSPNNSGIKENESNLSSQLKTLDIGKHKLTNKDVSKTFSDIKITKSNIDNKGRRKGELDSHGTKKENLKWKGSENVNQGDHEWGKSSFSGIPTEHDDRFDKEENFYGIQAPRMPKTENQKQKFES